jgi:CHASE2 domain-containing sensor protein
MTKPSFLEILLDSVISTAMVLILMALLPLLLEINILSPFEKAFSDFQITDANYSELRDPSVIPADTNIVIIDVERLNMTGISMLLSLINNYQPKVVGIDYILDSGANDLENLALSSTLSGMDNLILSEMYLDPSGATLQATRKRQSDTLFSSAAPAGYGNLLFGRDKSQTTIRDFHPFAYFRGKKEFAFPLQIAKYFDAKSVDKLLRREKRAEIINYRGTINKFYFLTGIDILEQNQEIDFIKDKIVLLGVEGFFRGYDLLEDLYFTPMNENSSGRTFPDMSSVVIHANIISMIISGNYCEQMDLEVSILIAIVLCFFNMLMFRLIVSYNRSWFELGSLMIFLGESVLILGLTVYVFNIYFFQMKLTEALFASALSVFVFQVYNDSVKPLVLTISKFKLTKVIK